MTKLSAGIRPGSKWLFKNGSKGTVRVMGVIDDWVVCRRRGCAPFLVHAGEWSSRFTDMIGSEPLANPGGSE